MENIDKKIENLNPDLDLDSETTLLHKYAILEAKYIGLEATNALLRRRIAQTIEDCKQTNAKVRSHERSDILCDFIAEFYHVELLRYLKKAVGNQNLSWADVCAALNSVTDKDNIKMKCLEIGNFTEAEWQAVYEFKRTRNMRVHPRKNYNIITKIVRELPAGDLKTALAKMYKLMNS